MDIVMAGFNVVDCIVGALLLIGLGTGLKRGLSGEVATVVATIISGLAAWKFSGWARQLFLKNTALSAEEATVAGVVVVFVGAYVLLWIIRKAAAALMQFNFKGKAERIGGALCGLVRFAAITVGLLLIATFIPNEKVRTAVAGESVSGHFIYERVRPLCEDLAKKNGIELPPQSRDAVVPMDSGAPPIRDVEVAPPDVITNEVPAGMPLGPSK